MLSCPTADELEQIKRAVAIMTPAEKAGIRELGDEQILKIAADGLVDPAVFAIFINGFILVTT